MEQDQDMHPHHAVHDDYSIAYPPDVHSYTNPSSSFMLSGGISPPRFHHPHAFGSPHRHEQHEAEHVFNSPQLTLDPSTLNLRSNSNDNPPLSSANPSGSNSSTPTGSLRLPTYNQQNSLNASGVTTRRRARAALEQLSIQIQAGVHPEEAQSQHPHRQSDMQGIHIQPGGDMQIPVDSQHNSGLSTHDDGAMDHEQTQGGATPHPRDMYTLLPGNNSQAGYYLSSNTDGFANSPISPCGPPDASRDQNLQHSSTTTLDPPTPSSASIARTFRSGSLSLGISANRSMPLIHSSSAHASPVQQLSSHPHMHPLPYYPLQHQPAASPGFPSTPTTSHHTQGSSSSSHSSGHTRYSLRGSPGQRAFGHRHARSSSFGTVSTMSVRSTSPANSVASAFTSLSGGGSAPASASGLAGSPSSYAEGNDVPMQFSETPPPTRAQSHPPLSMPTAHPALTAYSALLPPPRKSLLQQGSGGYLSMTGGHVAEEQRQSLVWPPPPEGYLSPPPGPRMTGEEFEAQFRPKQIITRAPHRKQKLANSDRKAICMYAKQHPNARQEDIAARYNVERSTISKILKNKERWLGCPDDEAKVARKRKPRFDDLEFVLKHWVEETRDQGIVLSDALIRSKAKEEARQLGISEEKFKASSGWLENFKHRVGIRKGKYIGREQWVAAASDSENEEPPFMTDELQKQRIIFMADPPPGYDRTTKGALWRMPIEETQRQPAEEKEQPGPTVLGQSEQILGSAQPNQASPGQGSAPPEPVSRADGARSASRGDGRQSNIGMRKTRSRTLAEAREAALAGGLSPPSTTLAPAPVLAPAPILASAPALSPAPVISLASGHSQESLQNFSQTLSSNSHSPVAGALPDGREASAGLDVALDFIGCQPEGFATPEEVAVLQKLSRKMSRAEPLSHHSASCGPSDWSGVGES